MAYLVEIIAMSLNLLNLIFVKHISVVLRFCIVCLSKVAIKMEKSNIITVAWTGILNTDPAMVYISVRPSRYSYNLIKEHKKGKVVCLSSKSSGIRPAGKALQDIYLAFRV